MKTTTTSTPKILAAIILLVTLMLARPAAAINSNGTGGGNWNATSTWQGGVVPTTSSQAVIQSSDTVTVSDSEAFNSMSVNGILTINSTGTLTMSGTGVVSVNGTINNSGIFVNSVTSGSPFAGSGTFNNFAGATVDFTADTFFPSSFSAFGWPNTINFAANSTIEFGGTSTCNGEYDLAFTCSVLVAGGTLSSGSPTFFDGNLTYNSGTLNLSGGIETFQGTANQSISGTSEPVFSTLVVDNTGTPPGNTVYEYNGTQTTTTLTAGNLEVAAVAAGANNVGAISVASSATLTVTNAVANGYVSGTTLSGGTSASHLVFDFTGVNPSTTAAALELSGAISGFTSAHGSTITILGTGIPAGASVYKLASFASSTAPSFSTVTSPSGLICTITTSATGITMTVAAAALPTITPSVTTFPSAFTATSGSASSPQSFTVSGSLLTGNVTVTAGTGFQVCATSGGTYTSSITLAESGGTLTGQPVSVYVELAPTAATGSYNSATAVTLSGGGATSVNVTTSASGNTVSPLTPGTITPSVTTFPSAFTATSGSASSPQSFTVSGSLLTGNVTVTAGTGFQVCATSGGTYTSSITLAESGGTLTGQPVSVYVELAPTAATGSYNSATAVTLSGGGATSVNVTTSASGNTVSPLTPGTITPSVTTFPSAFTATSGSASSPQSFTVSGSLLTGNVTVTAGTGFQVCATSGGTYTSSITLAESGGTLTGQPVSVYVELAPTAATGSYNSATAVTLSGGGATSVNVTTSASGNTVSPAAAINSNGTGGGNWNATSTWQGGVVPTTSAQVTIQSSDTVTVSDSEAFHTLSVNGILTINSTGTLTMSGTGVVSVNGTINNSGVLVNSVTSGSAFAGSGTFNNFAGATVDFTADTFFPSSFSAFGWPNTVNFAVNSTIEFGGTSTCNGEYDLAFPCNVLVGGGTLSSGSPLFLDGNLTYNSGTLNLSGGMETFAGTANQSISGTSEPAFSTLVVDNTGTSPGNTVYEYSGTQATTTLTAGNLEVAAVAAGANNVGAISVASSTTLTVTNAVANGYVSGTTLTGGASASGLVFDFTGVNPSTTAASLELSGAISGFTSADGSTITILGTGIPTGASVYQLASFASSTAPSFSTVTSPSGLVCTITTSATGITMTVASALRTPSFTGLTASQSIYIGQTSITLSGKVSATGPIYPASGETITVTINGNAQTTTIDDSTGDFSFTYNPSTIPASGTPYTITYSYAGDAALSQASDTSTTLTVQPRPLPTLNAAYYNRVQNESLNMNMSGLLANGSDSDPQITLTLGYISPSTNGTALFNDGTYIYYTNSTPVNVNDAFQYYVMDGFGDDTTNEVFISIVQTNGQQTPNPGITVSGSSVSVTFFGVPGYVYDVERNTNLGTGAGWVDITNVTTPAGGVFTITDWFNDVPNPPPASAYYRLLVP